MCWKTYNYIFMWEKNMFFHSHQVEYFTNTALQSVFITFGPCCVCKMSLLVICRSHTQMTEFCSSAQKFQKPLIFLPIHIFKRFTFLTYHPNLGKRKKETELKT